jgi:exonuclease SbcC
LTEVGYDAEAHEALKARVQELSVAETEYRELEKARVGVQGEVEALKRVAKEIAAQEQRVTELVAERDARQVELDALKPQLDEAPSVLAALKDARRREVDARQQVGAARQTLAALDTQARRRERFAAQRAELAEQVALLTELRDAFGVNGIPAMIIEHTLPELEREANRILEQLTGGRMHVRFETQRETKSGNVRETLDIIISDEKGTRPYESFSGGEKFRINFAIRVALSQLLAQRAGVRLRSLFVDEGFGSLDADGRRRLVEAVKAVQTDFDLILVITHIEELQDAFPVRIEVEKTETGSQVQVI